MISQKPRFGFSCLMPLVLLLGALSCPQMKGDKSAGPLPEQYLKLIPPDRLKIHLTELASDK